MRALLLLLLTSLAGAAAPLRDEALQAYFTGQAASIASNGLAQYRTLADWQAARPRLREQLFEMLSLAPLPPREDLRAVVTGTAEREDFRVENLHFQSMPGLYVTANLYLPKKIDRPLPAILYLCGHGPVKTNGISYGNKVRYQHHAAWFARHGYACLILDTLQLGEIEGLHHGTYREGMWWWNSRGYTPAGVEAWNAMRALDYLEERPEVDRARLGVTGRSGGGAYSWWLAALDDRIQVAAPVAGITDLQDHLADGVVDGHCDCMYFVNTYRWDFPTVAALVAPRPLLIANTDKDSIFPLDGVVRVHAETARIYDLYREPARLGLLITEGPHADTQDLQVPVFRWFNRFLKQDQGPVEVAARPFFQPEELRVFSNLPADERNTRIQETFPWTTKDVPRAAGAPPCSVETLREQVFRAWPSHGQASRQADVSTPRPGWRLEKHRFESQPGVPVELHLWLPAAKPESVRLRVLHPGQWASYAKLLGGNESSPEWAEFEREAQQNPGAVIACFFARGAGPVAWQEDERRLVQIRRRFMLAGQTLAGMRVYDTVQALRILHEMPRLSALPIDASAQGDASVQLLLAAIFQPDRLRGLHLGSMPGSWETAPDFLNIARCCSLDELPALLPSSVRVTRQDAAP